MEENQKTILIIDDDNEILELLKKYLEQHGFNILTASDGSNLFEILANHSIDLIILDIMLPGDNGYDICRNLRMRSQVPVIMITAVSEETDTIIGLELGADDYLTKPFNPRELFARIRAIFRRMRSSVEPSTEQHSTTAYKPVIYHFANWKYNQSTRTLTSPEDLEVQLSSAEYDLLNNFLEHPIRILTRDQLLELTRNREAMPYDRSIDILVSRLRQKLEINSKEPKMIKTIRNQGYIFTEKVFVH